MTVTCSVPLYALGLEPAAVLGLGHQVAGCGTMPPPLHRCYHTPHPLRHGGVAASFTAGVTDGYKISRYLGHGTPASAYRLYGHLLSNDESEVTARLSAGRAKAEGEVAHSLPWLARYDRVTPRSASWPLMGPQGAGG